MKIPLPRLLPALGQVLSVIAIIAGIIQLKGSPIQNFRLGMTLEEALARLHGSFSVLDGANGRTNLAAIEQPEYCGTVVCAEEGFSLYFENGRLISVYQKPWYAPVPVRKWLGLGPADPLIGEDLSRRERSLQTNFEPSSR